ncbi:MAG: cytochrome-c peroxidase [Chromatiales bacterium]|nr:cytochrome-c peroxidase [Chromatiales bacterium]
MPRPADGDFVAFEPMHTAALTPSELLPAAPRLDVAMELRVFVPELPGPGEPIRPIPDVPDADPEKVALGRALFHDPRLSRDNTTACASCHDLGNGGDDGRAVSIGVDGRSGPINAPTVFNAGLNFRQFWDGRAKTLVQQIDGPVQSPVELGSLWPDVIVKLYEHESYPARFQALYPEGITRANVKDALAEFMRTLTTPDSRFDRWLEGDADALEPHERRGYALFKHYGCISCHQGANVGGNMFQVFGVLNEYFKRRGNITDADLGRFNITGNPADRHAFKVPSLRMAALTAPYLHDGSAATLRDAVDAMFEFQIGREAPDADKDDIVAFIETLVGENRELFQ